MKQGRATHSRDGSTKTEPVSHTVSPCAAAQIGIMQGNHASDGGVTMRVRSEPLYEGRGLKAPMVSTKSHKGGSQGRY